MSIALCTVTACLSSGARAGPTDVPYWLAGHAEQYTVDPRATARAWFAEAKFGMFVHLNLASLCQNGKADYLVWEEGKAPDRLLEFVGVGRDEYEHAEDKNRLLFDRYRLPAFDAKKICALVRQAEMRYVTFTVAHLGRCFNYRTAETDFNSMNAPCGRDLVEEMARACQREGLALFLYLPPEFATTTADRRAINLRVIEELLTGYGPIAGIWFDGISGFYHEPEDYEHLKETYAFIRSLQPHCLVSFKEGAVCDEDFITPEHFMMPFEYRFDTPERQARWKVHRERWERHNAARWEQCNRHALREINSVMQECVNRDGRHVPSGWINDESARHLSGEGVYYWLTYARYTGSNLLMNIGPRPDGSIHPDDRRALERVGAMIRERGWPPVRHPVR